MLLKINTETRYAEKRRTERLQSFGLDERALQDILFRSLDRLFPDDELILLMQSRSWQEEPDLMAVDKGGQSIHLRVKSVGVASRKSASSAPLWPDLRRNEIP